MNLISSSPNYCFIGKIRDHIPNAEACIQSMKNSFTFSAHWHLVSCYFQAGKLIANLIVMGSGIIGRAMLQAYRKALESKFLRYELCSNPHLRMPSLFLEDINGWSWWTAIIFCSHPLIWDKFCWKQVKHHGNFVLRRLVRFFKQYICHKYLI
jgi:hypothetical protein